MEEIHNFCCWCCSCGGFFIKAKIPKSGYVPGEIIKVEIFLKNSSTVKVHKIYINFVQKIKFSSNHKTSINSIIKFDRFEWKNIENEMSLEGSLIIPQCPPTSIGDSRLVRTTYFVNVRGKLSGCHLFPVILFPITIGTIPLREEIHQFSEPTAPITDEAITTIDTTIQI